jgi:hypothetical protein
MNYWLYMENPWLAGFLSFLIGFGIAAMFRPMCHGSDCIVLHGPPVQDVLNKVYQMGGNQCVEFTTEVVACPTDGSEIVKTIQPVASV